MQTNMEAKLQELYGEYKKLDNGNYYVRLSNGNELYIPSTINSDQSLLAYAPGAGGSRNDATHLRAICESSTPPSCVVAISSSCSDNYDILGMGTNVINSLGGQVNNAIYASFSASGIKGLQQGEAYLQNNPNVSLSIVSCDGCGTYNSMSDKYPLIKETETPFIMITGGRNYEYAYQKMNEAGYNAYYLTVNNKKYTEHIQLNKDMIDYLLLYTLGETDEIPENDLQYQLYKGTFDSTVDFENMRCAGAGTLAGYDRNIYKKVLKLGALSFTGLDNYSDTDKIGDGYVKSDFEFLSNSLNQIRSTISKANIATKTPSLPIAGANGLLSAITSCIAQYSAMTVDLYAKLGKETEATQSYGQSIINLDLQQKGQLEGINNGVTLENTTNNSGSNESVNNTTNNGTTTNQNTGTNNGYTGTTGSNGSGGSTGSHNTGGSNGSSNGGSSTGAGLAAGAGAGLGAGAATGGGSTGSRPTGGGTTGNTSTNTSSNNTPTPTTTNPIINGNDMTWQYADGHNLTLTVDNGQVTNMKFTYNYSSADELNKNINNILVGEIDKQYFDKMTILNNSVEITIKPDYFKELSLDKIKELFFKGGVI